MVKAKKAKAVSLARRKVVAKAKTRIEAPLMAKGKLVSRGKRIAKVPLKLPQKPKQQLQYG